MSWCHTLLWTYSFIVLTWSKVHLGTAHPKGPVTCPPVSSRGVFGELVPAVVHVCPESPCSELGNLTHCPTSLLCQEGLNQITAAWIRTGTGPSPECQKALIQVVNESFPSRHGEPESGSRLMLLVQSRGRLQSMMVRIPVWQNNKGNHCMAWLKTAWMLSFSANLLQYHRSSEVETRERDTKRSILDQ